MTVEQLQAVIKLAFEIADNTNVGPRDVAMYDVVKSACDAIGVDKRFHYPIVLAMHWSNDLEAWANAPDTGVGGYVPEPDADSD